SRDFLRTSTTPSGTYPVLFSTDCLSGLFGVFSGVFSARKVIDRINPWGESLGAEIISKKLTVYDDPVSPLCFRKTLFDSEGTQRKKLVLIEDGVLRSFYHNS